VNASTDTLDLLELIVQLDAGRTEARRERDLAIEQDQLCIERLAAFLAGVTHADRPTYG
jgi:hypothetical protein